MESVLDIVIMTNKWNLWELSILKCVNKSCKSVVENVMGYESQLIFKEMNQVKGKELFCERLKTKSCCNKCGERTFTIYPFSNGKKHCSDCRELYQCTKTEAKTNFKLNDGDLQKLDFSTSVHFLYGTTITYYSRRQVISFSLLKHGGNLPKKKSHSSAKEKRENQVYILKQKYGNFALLECFQYIQNGKGGIKKLEESMKSFVLKNKYTI